MIRSNANDVTYEVVSFDGKKALFSDERLDKKTIPNGWHCYDIRHGDDWGNPVTLERNVLVNFYGSILTDHEIPIPKAGYIDLANDRFSWLDGRQTMLKDFLAEGSVEKESVHDNLMQQHSIKQSAAQCSIKNRQPCKNDAMER